MRFGTAVEGAVWDEDAQEWEVRIAGGDRVRATYLITATGFLSQPRMPDIAGVEDFAGTVLHSARGTTAADLDGKRVAIIGTGATAVQLIPELAERAGAPHRLPAHADLGDAQARPARCRGRCSRLFARLPFTQRVARRVNTAVLEVIMVAGVSTTGRAKVFNRIAERVAKRHLRRQVEDPELRAS